MIFALFIDFHDFHRVFLRSPKDVHLFFIGSLFFSSTCFICHRIIYFSAAERRPGVRWRIARRRTKPSTFGHGPANCRFHWFLVILIVFIYFIWFLPMLHWFSINFHEFLLDLLISIDLFNEFQWYPPIPWWYNFSLVVFLRFSSLNVAETFCWFTIGLHWCALIFIDF